MALITSNYFEKNALSFPRPILSRRYSGQAANREADYGAAFVKSAAEIPDELWAAFSPPAEGRWFYEALEGSGLGGFSFFYAKVSSGGAAAGFAPIFLTDVPVARSVPEKLLKPLKAIARVAPSILYQRTLFVGCPCSQGGIGVREGADRRQVLLALQRALERKAREVNAELIVWKDMPPCIAGDLDWLAKRRRLFPVVSLPGTMVRFSSQKKSDYIAQLKRSWRRSFKKKLALGAAEADLSVEVLQHPEPDAVDEMFFLFAQTYRKSKVKFEELNRTWFAKLAEAPQAHFIVLREKQTGAMTAFMACLDCGSFLINKHVGFDYSKPKSWMLYFRLWDAAVDWALSKGFSCGYSGQTAYLTKIETGHELIPLVNYVRHGNVLLHAIFRKVAGKLDWASLDEGLAVSLKAHPEALLASLAVEPGSTVFHSPSAHAGECAASAL
jgi:Acetyltransferase (GNAT) domain